MDDEDEGQLRDIDPAEHPGEHHHHDGLGDDIHGLNGVNDVGAELGLNALRDSPEGVKPFYPYSTLIRYAIKGSPGQRLLLEDIYYAIETRFPWFKTAPAGWKTSMRHGLSRITSMLEVPCPLTDRGKGAYWTVNDQVDPHAGVHRVRKKKPRGPTVNSKHNQAAHDAQLAAMGNVELSLSSELDEAGRPIWRSIWLNELLKLQHATAEAERNGQDQDWYRYVTLPLRLLWLVSRF
ncbi:winged helix DNA-binding domain-containing protein [Clavulina sp. PMI_390]|nr:winged helix DNA-binding domain-containing protein [Clavulina sp. PMI_390]